MPTSNRIRTRPCVDPSQILLYVQFTYVLTSASYQLLNSGSLSVVELRNNVLVALKLLCICRLPSPKVQITSPFRAQIFDSWFEAYRGPIVCVYVLDGAISKGQRIRTYHRKCEYEVLEVGIMHPDMCEVQVRQSAVRCIGPQ